MKQRTGEIPPATITEPPPEPKVPRNVFSPSLSLMDINDEELARQLTLMEFETFRAIRVRHPISHPPFSVGTHPLMCVCGCTCDVNAAVGIA
jgi:hypothetical protein